MKIKTIFLFIYCAVLPLLACNQGFLRTEGTHIINDEGNFLIRSIGTGNWMIQEGYMMQSTDAGIHTQYQFRNKLIETMGEARTNEFYDVWLENHFTKTDLDSMKVWGFNSLRVAIHYKWFTLPIEEEVPGANDKLSNTWLDKGFSMLDDLLSWCEDNKMYLIIDMHGAPGGQGKNADISDYDPSKPSLWESEENKEKLIALWRKLAERYKNSEWIGGFDLINETNWNVDGSGNENGCNCLDNGALWELHQRIIEAIREVDQNHIVYISGNCWGNNYNGFDGSSLKNDDNNMVLTFHKYWNYNDTHALDGWIAMRDQYGLPLWMSEGGENSNVWFRDAIRLFEDNNMGWSWWPVKKNGINNILRVIKNANYSQLIESWKSGNSLLSADETYEAVMTWAENHKINKCIVMPDVIDAMTRQVYSEESLAYSQHSLGREIYFSDYDLGQNGYAYYDKAAADYHGNTGNFTAWNEGWEYRSDGVDIGKSQDNKASSNGYYVGWTESGEWLQYTIPVKESGIYAVLIRHASATGGSKVHFELNGKNVSGSLTLPGTAGWENWETSFFYGLDLPEGELPLRLVIESGSSNFSYFLISGDVSVGELNEEEDVQAYPNPTQNNVTIKFGGASCELIRGVNSKGELIYSQTISPDTDSFMLQMEAWAKGLYIVELSGPTFFKSLKIIRL